MAYLPPPDHRPEDKPLQENVRWLGAALGQAIRRFAGQDAYAAVEQLRRQSRARRRGESDAPDLELLLEQVTSLSLETRAVVARAFTLYFLLINTAEQVHRTRRRRDHARRTDEPSQPGSSRWAFARLKQLGHDAATVRKAVAALEVRPVLTAHPTEATRRTILSLQARIAEGLLARDAATELGRLELDHQLESEIELLWLTASVRTDRPQVADEISTVLWYLEDRFFDAGARVCQHLAEAFGDVYGEELGEVAPVVLGTWVGGDRDGNPYVTPEVTLAAARRNAWGVIGRYIEVIDGLIERFSLSSRMTAEPAALRLSIDRDRELLPEVWEQNKRRDRDEPVRLKLSFVKARLIASRDWIAARYAGERAYRSVRYTSADEFAADLRVVELALREAGATYAVRAHLQPVFARLRMFGLHGMRLDIREDAQAHTNALADIARSVGVDLGDRLALQQELLGRRPLVGAHLPLEAATRRVASVFGAIRTIQEEIGPAAAETYIISMTRSADDLLRVLLLAREEGLIDLASEQPRSAIDIVPLFETRADLRSAPDTMRTLFADAAYQRQLAARGMRQEIMLGYSDSAKDAGVLPAAWALYQAQLKLSELCEQAGVKLTLFHGQGGTVGRGGGSPVFRGLTALPPGTINGSIKITEQGEVISQKFGLLPIAERSLEVSVSGTLMASFSDWRKRLEPGEHERFREVMTRLADLALPVFRKLVHEDNRLFELFTEATPVRELANVHFGSRPAYRARGAGTMSGIRAIPWVFGWTQNRLMLPAWLGAGTALSTMVDEPGGLDTLRRMAEVWPFFDDLLGKIEMVCAKSDMDIARLYVSRLKPGDPLIDELVAEFERTVRAMLAIRGTEQLLADQPLLQTALALRDPYVDPLSLIQISLLEAKRNAADGTRERVIIDEALGATLNGIAQGLRNTG